jgi:hypothetical protein
MITVSCYETVIKRGIFKEKYEQLSISDEFVDNDPILTAYSNEIF